MPLIVSSGSSVGDGVCRCCGDGGVVVAQVWCCSCFGCGSQTSGGFVVLVVVLVGVVVSSGGG